MAGSLTDTPAPATTAPLLSRTVLVNDQEDGAKRRTIETLEMRVSKLPPIRLYSVRNTSLRSIMNYFRCFFRRRSRPLAGVILAWSVLLACSLAFAGQPGQSLELSRPVRSWEFVSAVGTRAGIFGNEQGTLEAWVYPLKILSDFHLRFHVDGTVVPAESLARTLEVRPESSISITLATIFPSAKLCLSRCTSRAL